MPTNPNPVPCAVLPGRGDAIDDAERENGKREYEEIAGAIIFWRGALAHQYTADTQAFVRAQIARLEARADELARWEDESC